jgi:hypothetical protein
MAMGQVDVRAVWFQSVLARDLPATSIAVFPACGHRVRILIAGQCKSARKVEKAERFSGFSCRRWAQQRWA